MADDPPLIPNDGRTPGWRAGMLFGAALLCGIGKAVLRWPQIIVWAIAGVFFVVAILLLLSALFARGRRG